jgi:predicted NBD/HSP70 family sugar kinase
VFLKELQETARSLSHTDFQAGTVAIPGQVDRKRGRGIVFGNLPWKNVSIQADCEQLFNCPILVENDANLAGLSEALALDADYHKVLYVTISTGIGGGLITDNAIDPDFADAEIGHMLMEHGDRLMRWEEFASGKAIVSQFGKRASEITDPQEWYIVARNIAIGLIAAIASLTPDIVIIGGGVGSHFDKFKDRLFEELKIYENPLLKMPPVVKAQRAEEAVIYGCYELARKAYGKHT